MFSHEVTAATLVFQNNETAAMLVVVVPEHFRPVKSATASTSQMWVMNKKRGKLLDLRNMSGQVLVMTSQKSTT